ncbi:hypothetical protein WICPIJ_009075 [Wickerhamomyces pijperi]|uniref:Uncharacterized protein n=1 Tax=Wickerhamomyces pijperi TaxID=599730 RepID=A0A9P8PRT1_WICPI|nr:hypothetical protein WICPIJ_009075 [Wickerhamomyces pijperi]
MSSDEVTPLQNASITPWEVERHQLLSQIQSLQEELFSRQNEGIKNQAALIANIDILRSENQMLKIENQRLHNSITRDSHAEANSSIIPDNQYVSLLDGHDSPFTGGSQLGPASMTPSTPVRQPNSLHQSTLDHQFHTSPRQPFMIPDNNVPQHPATITLNEAQSKRKSSSELDLGPTSKKSRSSISGGDKDLDNIPRTTLHLSNQEIQFPLVTNPPPIEVNNIHINSNANKSTSANNKTKSRAKVTLKVLRTKQATTVTIADDDREDVPEAEKEAEVSIEEQAATITQPPEPIDDSLIISEEKIKTLRNREVNYSSLSVTELLAQVELDFKQFFADKLVCGAIFQNHAVLSKVIFVYFSVTLKIPIVSIQKTKYKKALAKSKKKQAMPKKDIYEYLCANCRKQIFEVSQVYAGSTLQKLDYISHDHRCDLSTTLQALHKMRKKGMNRKDSGLALEEENARIEETQRKLTLFSDFVGGNEEYFNLFLYITNFKLVDLNYLAPLILSFLFEFYEEYQIGSRFVSKDSYAKQIEELIHAKDTFKKLRTQFSSLFFHIFRFDQPETLNHLKELVTSAEASEEPLQLVNETNKKKVLNCDFHDKYSKMVRNSITKALKSAGSDDPKDAV